MRLGQVWIPLNYDLLTELTLAQPNTFLVGSRASLDSQGNASARLDVPKGLPSSAIGAVIHTAFVTYTGPVLHMASNPVSLTLSN